MEGGFHVDNIWPLQHGILFNCGDLNQKKSLKSWGGADFKFFTEIIGADHPSLMYYVSSHTLSPALNHSDIDHKGKLLGSQ